MALPSCSLCCSWSWAAATDAFSWAAACFVSMACSFVRYLSRELGRLVVGLGLAGLLAAGDERRLVLADAGVQLQGLVDEDVDGAVADQPVDQVALQRRPVRLRA